MKQGEKQLQLFIRHITTAAANVSLYHPDHPQVLDLCVKALEQLQILLADFTEITLKLVDNRLIHEKHPVSGNLSVERLIESMRNLGVGYIKITPGPSSEELIALAAQLSKSRAPGEAPRKTEHIRFGVLEVRYRDETEAQNRSSAQADFSAVAEQDRDKFMDIFSGVKKKKELNVVGISEIVGDFIDTFSTHGRVLLALAPLRSMDEYVYTHSTNICLLNVAQAKLLGIEGPLLKQIGIAAMLHDVGKMFVSPDILNKEGKLDREEWAIMQQHPQLGAEYLLGSSGIPRLAVVTTYEHHIGYDGSGYPSTPRNWRLSTCSHMTTISDVYDALRTRRAYKEPLSFEQIRAIMLDSAGKSLHPELTRAFLHALGQMEKEAA